MYCVRVKMAMETNCSISEQLGEISDLALIMA
jgi:hypothetical protein